MEFKEISASNVDDIIRLKVCEGQRDFVAPNIYSLAEAYATNNTPGMRAMPFGIYDGDVAVGFIMLGYNIIDVTGKAVLKAAENSYLIWRLMIAAEYQGRGYGRFAMAEALKIIRTMPCGDSDRVWVSYEPENTVAKALYASFGFVETGEICEDEAVAILCL